MDEVLLIETVERYLKGDMTQKERDFFEEIRKNNPAVDQMVVEHTFLFHELDKQANIKAFKHSLYEVENKLTEEGLISKEQLTGKAKVVFLWKKYKRSIAVELFGMQLPSPILLAPVGVLSIVHPGAEVAVAKAAKELRIPQVVSTVSSKTIEEIAEVHGEHPHWFQLYWGRNNDFTRSVIDRAEKAAYNAIVVTLDTRLFAWRERDIKNAYLPFLYNEGLANYLSDPVFLKEVGDPSKDKMKTMMQFANCFSNPSSTWEDLAVIRECTKLPVIVKGIQHPDDAKKAIDHGADGIIVSNHGGRQMDGAIGALDTLSGIADAVGDKTTLLFDSGIRRGADVFKAMALGAEAVLLGRPYVYGLAIAGEKGVKEVLANLLADTDLTMGLAGCSSWKEVTKDRLHFKP